MGGLWKRIMGDGGAPEPRPAGAADRHQVASLQRRRLEYSPQLDGDADPGEVVWTWVAYEEDASRGKDRPVLVVGRDGTSVFGLLLSSQAAATASGTGSR